MVGNLCFVCINVYALINIFFVWNIIVGRSPSVDKLYKLAGKRRSISKPVVRENGGLRCRIDVESVRGI